MDINVSLKEGKGVLKLSGRFDFNAHREYRDGLDKLVGLEGTSTYVIDLEDVSYLDSSALGMLLLLRDKAKQANKTVSITGVKGTVKQVLEIANFAKMFQIS